jgi:hypothetical protein
MKNSSKFIILTALFCANSYVFANHNDASTIASKEISAQQTPNGINYINGGIGEHEQESIKQKSSDYNLHIKFSRGKDNEYVTGVKVTILDKSKKEIFTLDDAGPITHIKLEPGKYKLISDRNGKNKYRSFIITSKINKNLYLHWDK